MNLNELLKDQIRIEEKKLRAQLHYRDIQSCAAMKCLEFVIGRVNNGEPSLPEETIISLYKIKLSRLFISGKFTRYDVNTHKPVGEEKVDFELLKELGYNFNESKAHEFIEEEKKSMMSQSSSECSSPSQ